MSSTRSRTAFAVPLTTALAATLATSVAVSVAVLAPTTPAAATDWGRCLSGPADRQAVFTRAAEARGVPAPVLLGVSYLKGRWDDHGASPSTSGGYGPMHLVQVDTAAVTGEHARARASRAEGTTAGRSAGPWSAPPASARTRRG